MTTIADMREAAGRMHVAARLIDRLATDPLQREMLLPRIRDALNPVSSLLPPDLRALLVEVL